MSRPQPVEDIALRDAQHKISEEATELDNPRALLELRAVLSGEADAVTA